MSHYISYPCGSVAVSCQCFSGLPGLVDLLKHMTKFVLAIFQVLSSQRAPFTAV